VADLGVQRVLVFALICGFVCGCSPRRTAPDELLREARAALAEGRFDRAEDLASGIPESSELWAAGRELAGEAATKAGRLAEALQHYLLLASRSDRPDNISAGHFYSAEIYRELGRLSEAEQAYRKVLALDPENAATHERLAFLLSVTGRRWESLPHYWFLARSGTAQPRELMALADLDRPVEHRDFLEQCARKAPDDPLVRLGLAVYGAWEDPSPESAEPLRAALSELPDLISAQALLGELLVDKNDREFLEWHAQLPPVASRHPEIWYVRGMWARRHAQPRVAARCFWEAVRLEATHRRAMYHLGQVLTSLDNPAGDAFAERAQQLIRLTEVLDGMLRTDFRRKESFRETAELMEEMGRFWEACAWALAAERQFTGAEWPRAVYARQKSKLNDQLPLVAHSANPALRYDFSAYPDQSELLREVEARESGASPGTSPSSIRFVEEAAHVGIEFSYYSSPDATTRGARILEQTGGGVAVLDFDLDGAVDIYFTQGAEWPGGASEPVPSERYTDCLYRNSRCDFEEVTRPAGIRDQAYGQGCSAGDIDNDGFPDLYVANIGGNRLYINNGDGTFADATERLGRTGKDWTASCVIVDLNADAFPDLFDVTYLTAEDIYTRICQGRACSPSVFSGTPDRLRLSRGDGRFRVLPVDAAVENSKGLGVLAAVIEDRGRPSLFVANDQVANFFLRSVPDGPYGIRLEDQAFLSGLAFNEDGVAMACMGIAADDADGNGLIDFLVTNFHHEFNTLYLQSAPGLFIDGTKISGLSTPTWPYVGWGTQFLDADLDGEPDLVVVNGHVDDYRDEGGEYHMPPQFFRNTGRGRFAELSTAEIGPYFGRKYLGRGLARLDWNGDGRMDFAVSNIGDRASLVTNESTGIGHFLNVRLHATRTARDAIGAVVEVNAGGRHWTKQLVAGDGYMANNERVIQFGLGDAASVSEVRVTWPSGETSRFRSLSADTAIQLIEGSPRVIPAARWRRQDAGDARATIEAPRTRCFRHTDGRGPLLPRCDGLKTDAFPDQVAEPAIRRAVPIRGCVSQTASVPS
jgi:hypothetical protein